MRPDSKSVSFDFHRDILVDHLSTKVAWHRQNFRQRLQDKFDEETSINGNMSERHQGEVGRWNNLHFGNLSMDSRKALRTSAEKLSKTISSVRTTLGTISQKLRSSTRRRQILKEQHSPMNDDCCPDTPQTRSRYLLGRTPTKLYSPFGIESPKRAWGKENAFPSSSATSKVIIPQESSRPFYSIKSRGFSALR